MQNKTPKYIQKAKNLIDYVRSNPEKPLSYLFKEYAAQTGQSAGTIRNAYYAAAKRANVDENFKFNALNGEPLIVNRPVAFGDDEERDICKKIISLKAKGLSVRQAVKKISDGDDKLALRLQNKYRNVASNKPELIDELSKQAGITRPNEKLPSVSDFQLRRLKKEIDGLVLKISDKVRKENEYLKQRIAALETENRRLTVGNDKNTLAFFIQNKRLSDKRNLS